MSDLKMKTFDVHNNSPIVSRDSYSGSYRGFQMSYECIRDLYPEFSTTGDIEKIDIDALPDFDLLISGFPCKNLTRLAGNHQKKET